MKNSRVIKVMLAAVAITLGCGLLRCVGFTGGTETGEARVAGVLYNSGGSFAKHATVKVTRWNLSPRDSGVICATTITDTNGIYRFDSLPSDTFNILGSGDSGLSYLDSIVVNADDSLTQIPPDTLKAAGSIRGSIKLSPGVDPRTVVVLFIGTLTWVIPYDSSGNFTVLNLAEGNYRIRVLDTLDNYSPKDTAIAVTSGKENLAPNPLSLVSTSTAVISVAAGSAYSLFLKADSTLWACGYNVSGLLGDGTTMNRSTPVKVMDHVQGMDVGVCSWGFYSHSLVLKNDKTLWAFGSDMAGVVNDQGIWNQAAPIQIMTDVKSMAVGGFSHGLILKNDSTLWSYGRNAPNPVSSTTNPNYYPPVQVMVQVQSIDAGQGYNLVLKTDATLWAWGTNSSGQLGNGTTATQSAPVQVMTGVKIMKTGESHTLILKNDGTLWACGRNNYGQLGDGTTTNRSTPVQVMTDVKSMSAGYEHSLILKTDATLWACGRNSYGELGDGTTTYRLTPVQVMTDVKSMSAGGGAAQGEIGDHSLILKTDGTVLACGYNNFGQIGDGTTTNSVTPKIIVLPLK
jgi:alpha-tubulin suppressor-like RCC1 family protein